MQVVSAESEREWESFLKSQRWSPFLQSWTMGEVYRAVGQEPVRIELRGASTAPSMLRQAQHRLSSGAAQHDVKKSEILGICQAIVVPARRGKHLSVPYGPVFAEAIGEELFVSGFSLFVEALKEVAREKGCTFIRMSPFVEIRDPTYAKASAGRQRSEISFKRLGFRPSPLHLLAEHIWYLNLQGKLEEDIRKGMRATTRNLIGRAEREGVTLEVSSNPAADLQHFLSLHEETRKRHGFTPYTDAFFRAQVEKFSQKGECALYLARYLGEVVATSIHMIYGGETSYHHGASSHKFAKVPASHLLQWRAIQDALKRGDRVYNFWGIAPVQSTGDSRFQISDSRHPFAGVTTFKTGFGGELLELMHCMDLPMTSKYFFTWGIETLRKWRRGF